MPDESALYTLLKQASQGDEAACAALVRQLEPVIRRAVRVHFPADDPLRRLFDSLDVSQSVLLNFLAKAGVGALRFQGPRELRGLLRMMAAQKFIDKKRAAEAGRRDCRRDAGGRAVFDLPHAGPPPDEIAAQRELYQEVRHCLNARERQIADLWAAGHTFPEIAARVPGADDRRMKPNAVRMALERAFRRVAGEFSGGQ
jgi:DNA-directed RNA polymerase specialized sigma24 family protein